MTTKDEALRMALEALETVENSDDGNSFRSTVRSAADACREALAQKDEQEPVAFMYPDDLEKMRTSEAFCTVFSVRVGSPTQGLSTVKLYTAPPECRLLTEKEICDAWRYVTGYDIENGDSTEFRTMRISPDEVVEFARIVEGSIGVEHDAS